MHSKSTSICLSLIFTICATPAFSHSGHTSLFHSHSGIEYLLVFLVIAGIIYRVFKN